MRKLSLLTSLGLALLLTPPLIALLYLVFVLIGTAFSPFNLFDMTARLLPGELLTFGIDLMVDTIRALNLGATDQTAKLAEQVMAIAAYAAVAVISAAAFVFISARRLAESYRLRRDVLLAGLIFGVTFGVAMAIIGLTYPGDATVIPLMSAAWTVVAHAVWGLLFGYVLGRVGAAQTEAGAFARPINRRQFLIQIGGAAATMTVIGTGLGALISSGRGNTQRFTASLEPGDAIAARLPNADDPVVPAPGTRPEYTPLDQHYRIDINTGGGPRLEEETYRLAITGLVETTQELTLETIRALPPIDQFVTMSCISNRIAGDLISTTLWTGTSMQHVLDLARPLPEATHIKITAADGFDEFIALEAIRSDPSIMLAWAWDNQPLLQRHGFPLRIHIPDHFGMKQPKWITGMEFLSEWGEGYWVRRGWDREARVRATSVIDTVATDMMVVDDQQNHLIPIGGIAWAGRRGIARVEVRIDDGEWREAQLRSPLSDRTWVIWRYDWVFQEGDHTFAVRCVEADGTPQIEDTAGVRPSGATGIHTVSEML